MALDDRDYMKAPIWRRRQAAWEAKGRRRGSEVPGGAAPRPARRRRWPVAVVACVVGAVPGAAVGYAAGKELGPFAREPLLEWGGREFTTKADFHVWLAERGLVYREWVTRYPDAARRLERSP